MTIVIIKSRPPLDQDCGMRVTKEKAAENREGFSRPLRASFASAHIGAGVDALTEAAG